MFTGWSNQMTNSRSYIKGTSKILHRNPEICCPGASQPRSHWHHMVNFLKIRKPEPPSGEVKQKSLGGAQASVLSRVSKQCLHSIYTVCWIFTGFCWSDGPEGCEAVWKSETEEEERWILMVRHMNPCGSQDRALPPHSSTPTPQNSMVESFLESQPVLELVSELHHQYRGSLDHETGAQVIMDNNEWKTSSQR